MFSLDDLKVYQKALSLAGSAESFSSSWGKRHAVVDQFCRASESIVLNIAEGARLQSGPQKAMMADVAFGSTLECAACLDIAMIKGFVEQKTSITRVDIRPGKEFLSRIIAMITSF